MKEQKVIMFGVDGLIPELIFKFSREGYLPNITQLMQEGSTTELLPYISTWGDVNWVSFLTGLAPGNAWKGQSLPKGNDNTLLGLANSEDKKCALVHFPQTISTNDTKHFSFAPFYGGKEDPPFELATPRVFSTCLNKWPKKEIRESLGWPRTSSLAHHEKNNRSPIINEQGKLSFHMQFTNNIEKEVIIFLINEDKIRLEFDNAISVEINKNNWSNWVWLNLSNNVGGWIRFKLAGYNLEKQELDIIQSQLLQTDNISNQQELGEYLLKKNGPFIQSWTIKASPDEFYHDSGFEEAEYQAAWLADSAIELINNKGFDMFATVFRLNDETHHTSLGQYDPFSPFYKEELAPIYEENIRKSYIILDETIGKLLRNKDEDTTVILASDHGDVPNKYFCDIYLRLAEFGLCTIDEEGNPVLDKSKAILKDERGGLEIFVNLKGREANGIVPEEDYEFVQDSIYKALSTWVYKEKQVSALTLKKQDASIIGYWGSDMGDVIFAYNLGFVWGTNKKDIIAEVSVPGANHGPQIPSSKTEHSSNLGVFIASGKTSNKGYKRNIVENGPYLMDDAGKTIADLLGIKDTSTLDGRFMTDLFSK
ncbi:alkaline phosphatase family protein [Oceanobacillus jeddahense]|uniref:alkaline phosphatase family protein n=1 Tax=Oceanobacillus jeddahense TaxID=1462527 RepID=UPI0005960512|nr:alkaline phosphatase family protein [Oceanobacillus jeddahense]